jgi:CHAT domain-containing protein
VELAEREADYAQLLIQIKTESPEIAGLVSIDVASLAEVQTLLDSKTTLIEYFVTRDRTLAFVITRDTLDTATIDVSRDDLTTTISAFRDFPSLNSPYPASLEQLYDWLIAPLKAQIRTPVVGIIPHGLLHYLPFSALTNKARYLNDDYVLFTLPSASVLRFIQDKRKPSTNTLLALGNPAITEPGLAPLQFAEKEVEGIAKFFESQPLTGDLATESALRSQASSASIIHLAAHGQYNSSNPLFSVIYLAEDEHQDGRLEVNEIYGLDLTKSTDLVVLSACETQVGEISAGDEVVGLTRAFLYAGTPTVIASLWRVDDQATQLLMERFYEHLRAGMGKAQALQAAQNEVRAQYPHPYYWAAFILTGDAGTYVPPGSTSLPDVEEPRSSLVGMRNWLLLALCGLGLVTLLAAGILWWKRRKRV